MTRSMTSLSAPRFRLALWAVFLGTLGLSLVVLRHIAHAGTDPTVAMTSAVDTGISVWTTDGPLWLAVATGYVALRTFLSRQHWLSQGRVLAVLTGLAGIGAAVIGWHFSGAPSTGILTALLAAIALVQHPTVPPATARNPQSGRARLVTMTALALIGAAVAGAAMISCTHAQRTEAPLALIDCTAANAGAIGSTAKSMRADKADGGCATAGVTDWRCVEGKAIAAGVLIGGCAFLELVSAEAIAPVARIAEADGPTPPDRPGRAAFESYRASRAGGAAFRTAGGVQ